MLGEHRGGYSWTGSESDEAEEREKKSWVRWRAAVVGRRRSPVVVEDESGKIGLVQ